MTDDRTDRERQTEYDARLLDIQYPNVPPVLARNPVALAAARAYREGRP